MNDQRVTAFVTGGTGLLGSNIINELRCGHHRVKALVRSVEQGASIRRPEVELVAGDIRNPSRFEQALSSSDVLIHAAAYFSEFHKSGDATPLHDINVKGTIALLEAAYRSGIRNCVYISSAGVLAHQKGRAIDETAGYPARADDPYFESKINAEKSVQRFKETHPDMRVITILPTVMLGPGDRGPTPIGGLVVKLIMGQIKIVLPGSLQFVDARDVAKAVVTSVFNGSGDRYLVSGTHMTQREFYHVIGQATGKTMPTKQPPYPLLLAVAGVMKQLSKITQKPTPLDPTKLRRMKRTFWYSSKKAEQELNVKYRPMLDTMIDTVEWFQSENLI